MKIEFKQKNILRVSEKKLQKKEYYIKGIEKKRGIKKRIEEKFGIIFMCRKIFLSLVVLVKLHVLLATVRGEQQ